MLEDIVELALRWIHVSDRVLDCESIALIGILKIPRDHDDTFGTQHFHLEVRVVRDNHEFDETRYAEDGMIGVLKIHILKGEYLLVKVRCLTECNL